MTRRRNMITTGRKPLGYSSTLNHADNPAPAQPSTSSSG